MKLITVAVFAAFGLLATSLGHTAGAVARRNTAQAPVRSLAPAHGTTRVGQITEFPIPRPGGAPFLITLAADGALWFTQVSGYIGRITTAGVFTQYAINGKGTLFGITAGPDGALWFVTLAPAIGRISTHGKITLYFLHSSVAGPTGITAGPDGALWFNAASGVGRMTTSGQLTTFPQAKGSLGITTGPDGALWYSATSAIGRITTGGVVSTFPIPGKRERYLATGPDKKIWFTQSLDCNTALVGSVSTTGQIQQYHAHECSVPTDIALGPDGALWFTEQRLNHIDRITVGGRITRYPVPTENAVPYGIAAGPDGAMWFTEERGGKIGRIQAI
jgi:virginiamycin B lyase